MHYQPGNMKEREGASEGGRHAQHASVKEQFGFMGKPIRPPLIRIKCLSHLFSVADHNNESLNVLF